MLYSNGNPDKDGNFIVPPGTVEALKRYLRLAPRGGHVANVQALLDALKKPAK